MVLIAVALAGCAKGGSQPVPLPSPAPQNLSTDGPAQQDTAGPASAPLPAAAADPCGDSPGAPLQIWGGGPLRSVSGPGNCRFAVTTGPFTLHATVRAQSEETAAQAFRMTGAEPLWPATIRRDRQDADLWSVTLNLGEGKAGETITAAVAAGAAQIVATLTRKSPPTITILLQDAAGGWAPIESGISLPPGPKRLRFQTGGGLSVDALTPYYLTVDYAKLSPDRVTRVADDLLEVEFTTPPPLVQTYVEGGANADGLTAELVNGHFYIGPAPELIAVSPATGASQRIGPAPADLVGSPVLRKDGRYLALTTLLPESTSGQLIWLANLQTGALIRTPFTYEDGAGPGFDLRGRLIAPAGPGRLGVMDPETGKTEIIKTTATFWSRVSPDGRYVAGRVGPPPGRSTGAWVGPPRAYALVIRDLLDDSERVFPWTGYGGLNWLPDGRLLLNTVSTDEYPGAAPPPEKQMQFFTVDLITGQRTPFTGQWPPALPPAETNSDPGPWLPGDMPLVRLPDGRVLLYRWPNAPNARRGMI